LVIGVKIRPTCAPKNPKKGIVWLNLVEFFQRSLVVDDFAWDSVDEICSGDKGFIPEF
jgi:hypothetical protein